MDAGEAEGATVAPVIPSLDIFVVEKDGTLLWKGSAENFEVAKLSVKTLMATAPADYVIYSQHTGQRITIKVDGSIIAPNVKH